MKWCAIKKHGSIHARSPDTPFRILVKAKDMNYGHLMDQLIPLNIPKEANKGKTKPQRNKTKVSISSPRR